MSKFEKHSQLFVDTLRNIKTSFELVDISLVPISSSFSSYDKFLYNKFFINVDFLVHSFQYDRLLKFKIFCIINILRYK